MSEHQPTEQDMARIQEAAEALAAVLDEVRAAAPDGMMGMGTTGIKVAETGTMFYIFADGEDIEELQQNLMAGFAQQFGSIVKDITPEDINLLINMLWQCYTTWESIIIWRRETGTAADFLQNLVDAAQSSALLGAALENLGNGGETDD